jgi:hypothetical protein
MNGEMRALRARTFRLLPTRALDRVSFTATMPGVLGRPREAMTSCVRVALLGGKAVHVHGQEHSRHRM